MKDRKGNVVPTWFNAEMRALIRYQNLTVDEAYALVERLAIQEQS